MLLSAWTACLELRKKRYMNEPLIRELSEAEFETVSGGGARGTIGGALAGGVAGAAVASAAGGLVAIPLAIAIGLIFGTPWGDGRWQAFDNAGSVDG